MTPVAQTVLFDIISEFTGQDTSGIDLDTRISRIEGIDVLSFPNLLVRVEKKTGARFTLGDLQAMSTVSDLIDTMARVAVVR